MNTRDILQHYVEISPVVRLESLLKKNQETKIFLEGVCGSGPAVILSALSLKHDFPVLWIAKNKEDALYIKSDLENLMPGEHILYLPDSTLKPYRFDTENALAVQERIECISALRKNNRRIVVSYIAALAETVVEKTQLEINTYELQVGQEFNLDFFLEFLEENKFERSDFVFEPGQFSIRGGIIDIFSFAHENPFRLELDGEEINSIRAFDVNTQLSVREMDFFSLVPNVKALSETQTLTNVFSYLNEDTVIWADELNIQIEELKEANVKLLQDHQTAVDLNKSENLIQPDKIINYQRCKEIINNYILIQFGIDKPEVVDEKIVFNQKPQPLFHRNFDLLTEWLKHNNEALIQTLVFSENSRQIERLFTILSDLKIQETFIPIYQGMSLGFVCEDAKIAFTTEHQLFDKFYKPKSKNRYSSSTALTLRELKNLNPGDFVTHIDHGIGRFAGLEKMEMNGVIQESVRLVYKDNDLLYVSINSLHKIAKFSGKDGTAPSLHKLGSASWEKEKKNTKKKIKDIARELIQLYAKRKAQKGFMFNPDNYLQTELEASFFYEDTPDQGKAIADVKTDMEKDSPMDRLVCGDVGFGKTEVAIRAAFKACCDSKQVAILVPTTILAQQHYRTFSKRLKGFPVTVEYLNRFKTPQQQKNTLQKLAEGKVDIIIGTHRLLSKDVKFKDLGLLVIDEEQKFGVGAKDKLKEIKVNVDTLTLTATPIPRTLHFSLMGARDMSVIQTPPPNRQPVHTELLPFNRQAIKEAIDFEVSRGGQVFFIHNRVKDLYELQHLINEVCPQVTVEVGHGQMEGTQLEDVMVRFIEGESDVLLATTIIESGLDISNANTIIINNAHMFGLSDLHQMRGRVGRSNVKAYCYLLSPPLSVLPEDSRKRLRTLEEFNDLGSGFQVAMRDLDIRGAGNLLGGEQSGFISEMGFDMYQKILDEAVRELRAEELINDTFTELDISSRDCQIETDFEMLIPSNYVSNIAERLSLYSELSNIENEVILEQFAKQLQDRFGKIPIEVSRLFESMKLKWQGKKMGMEKISYANNRLRCFFPGDPAAAIYSSIEFDKMMGYIASNPTRCALKQTDKALILTITNINTVGEAIQFLGQVAHVGM